MAAPTKTPVRMYGPAQLPSASATRYTVPAGKVAVVRQVHVINPTAGAVTYTVSIGADAAGTRLFSGKSLGAGAEYDHRGYWVLGPGEVIQANASAGTSLVVAIFGDEYGGGTGSTGGRQQNNASVTDSQSRVTVTASATPHAVGAWVELISSTNFAAESLVLSLTNTISVSATDTSTLVTIGFGSAGNEVAKISNIPLGAASAGRMIVIPFAIPAGTRISARAQGAVASQVVNLACAIHEGGNGSTPPTSAVTYNADTATSNAATALTTAGAINTKSAWVELAASTSAAIRSLIVGLSGPANTNVTAAAILVDIGVGASGQELVVLANIGVTQTAAELLVTMESNRPFAGLDIPAGSRLVARYQAPSTNATVKPGVILIGLN